MLRLHVFKKDAVIKKLHNFYRPVPIQASNIRFISTCVSPTYEIRKTAMLVPFVVESMYVH